MKLGLFDYDLPENLIAQHPAAQRDASRLLIVYRATGETEDRNFSDLPEYLNEGDLLVLNDSRVIKARLIGERQGTGANIELFLLRRFRNGDSERDHRLNKDESHLYDVWECLAKPGKRLREGDRIVFGKELAAMIVKKLDDGSVYASFEALSGRTFDEALNVVGHTPLPPYIRRADETEDAERYQTVYAKELGSAAAPTAGLHFTPELLEKIRAKGVETVFVTLHVGLGTFRPVQTEELEDHVMHEEFYHISEEAARSINRAKEQGRRIVCVGTTSVRTLEGASVWGHEGNRCVRPGWGSTDIFLYPGGRKFFMTDALITNFHLPKSTLLMLVSAFYDREKVLEIYRDAVRKKYRFFSYGDAMLLL
ncbi:MAG: tRNA preQ1(34) S-adenosylmethionine ribosyltransferase-isomerase QueA [Clostridiales bacterium]|nr:tRNA preQ1(34) S-adenosylmethionine ribosyltransferase-isomerase QueA [Clostridiales bacterium]